MFLNFRFAAILIMVNLVISASLAWWISSQNTGEISAKKLEYLLEEISQNNPRFLVSLLNHAANSNAENDAIALEEAIFEKRAEILKSGFLIKKSEVQLQKTLIIFSDMTCPHCITFLKNVHVALPDLHCNVLVIPISVLGEKASYQAKLITSASLQNSEKAFKLALKYNASDGVENDMIAEAEKLGLNPASISQDIWSNPVVETIAKQTRIAEDISLPGVPSIFLLTTDQAYFLPPVEAKNLPGLIENPTLKITDEKN